MGMKVRNTKKVPARRTRGSTYPWDSMQVGQSFKYSSDNIANARRTARRATIASSPKQFSARFNGPNNDQVFIYRIK